MLTTGSTAVAATSGGKAATEVVIPELVVPGQPQTQPRTEELLAAGPQGFLHMQRDGYAWTRYDGSGTVKVANDDISPRSQFSYGSGSDTALVSTAYVQNNPPWVLKNMVTGTTTTLNPPALPSGSMYSEQGTFGDAALAEILVPDSPSNGTLSVGGMVLLRAADGGATASLTVTGWPDATVPARPRLLSGDADSVAFGFSDAQGKYRVGLVDTHTGVMTASPAVAPADPSVSACMEFFAPGAVLGLDRLAYVGNDCNVHVLSRADLTAPEKVLNFGYPKEPTALGLVGNTLLAVVRPDGSDPNATTPVQKELKAYPLDGSAPTTLLPHASPTMAQAPDGSVLVEGGSSSTDWKVRKVTGSAGAPTVTATGYRITPDAYGIDNLNVTDGVLTTAETGGANGMGFYQQKLTLGNTPAAGARTFAGKEGGASAYSTCGASACDRLLGTGDGRTVFLDRLYDAAQGGYVPEVVSMTADGRTKATWVDGRANQVVDAFGRYVLAGTVGTDAMNAPTKLAVVDLDTQTTLFSFDAKPAALGNGVLYTATGNPGEISVTDLSTQKQSRTIQTGGGCALSDLKTAAHWVYWSCGSAGPAGVQDVTGQIKLTVPAGASALGDGFAFYPSWNSGLSTVVDFHTGTAGTTTIPAQLRPDGYWAPWTVDKFGGAIAYRDSLQSIHVFSVIPTPSGGTFSPVDPSRLLDTRAGVGVSTAGKITAGKTASVQVAGRGGVPSGVKAVVLNVTVTEPGSDGHLTAWASGTPQPNSSNLNWVAGQTVPNLVVVPVGADGKVNLLNAGWEPAHIIADVFGYYSDNVLGSRFSGVDPSRLLDTRAGVGVSTAGKITAGKTASVQVAGRGGVPSGVKAVVLNVTVTEPGSDGHLTAWASGTPQPNSSNLNWVAGQTVPNLVVVPVGADGKVNLLNAGWEPAHIIADVFGYYSDNVLGSRFSGVDPSRLLDTRAGVGVSTAGKITAGKTASVQVAGRGGVPSGVKAVVLNVTVTEPGSDGHLTAWASGTPQPNSSNLNWVAGQTVPNLVVVPVGADGKVNLLNAGWEPAHIIADVFGYYS
ncbi:hypothetical protein [Kitasatospora cineracea]|uniref:hypothetical protein n=1 Tax=Kitasatospora cineracea TaxID=88074 RepID=UPI000F4E8BBE|nr:hypothetical protein [Kitasatospora cineracea]